MELVSLARMICVDNCFTSLVNYSIVSVRIEEERGWGMGGVLMDKNFNPTKQSFSPYQHPNLSLPKYPKMHHSHPHFLTFFTSFAVKIFPVFVLL